MNQSHDRYLCQVSETVSCGACCGLYNLPDLSRKTLDTILFKRTVDFASVPRTEDAIFEFQRKNKGPNRLSRPYSQFHHCPFLGYIGCEKRTVGCLLHPEATGNNGTDYRCFSWYGEQACRLYLCPSAKQLSAQYKKVLKLVIDDWYLYGLLVTEYRLVTGYFKEIESRLGRQVTVADYVDNKKTREALNRFLGLKLNWSYRRPESPGPCNYFFENGLYDRPTVFRAHPEIRKSHFEEILKELDSGFASDEELLAAEIILEKLFREAELSIS